MTDFSVAGNPNGVWTYGQGSGGATFSALTTSETVGGLLYWENAPLSSVFPAYYPRFLRNTTGSDIVSGNYVVFADSLELAATSSSDVILQFIAPTAGIYTFTGDFRGSQGPFGTSAGTTAEVFIFANSASVLANSINGTGSVGINFSRTCQRRCRPVRREQPGRFYRRFGGVAWGSAELSGDPKVPNSGER